LVFDLQLALKNITLPTPRRKREASSIPSINRECEERHAKAHGALGSI
jgi:hypothetical protein